LIPIYNENLIIDAVEKGSKNVVNIASVRMMKDQLLRIFPIEGVGSGVIVDKKGHILTNNHVIEKADKIKLQPKMAIFSMVLLWVRMILLTLP
jgi:serine protease Do